MLPVCLIDVRQILLELYSDKTTEFIRALALEVIHVIYHDGIGILARKIQFLTCDLSHTLSLSGSEYDWLHSYHI